LISDDPHAVGSGNVEVVLAVSTRGQVGADLLEAPLVDLTLGVAQALDLTLVGSPAFRLDSADKSSTTGILIGGLKWQPIATKRFAASFSPAIGTSDLESDEFFVNFPMQAEVELDRYAFGADLGYAVNHRDPDAWNASLYGSYPLTQSIRLLGEFWAQSGAELDDADFGAGVGVDWLLVEGFSLLAMAGTGIDSLGAERVDWVGYLGVQFAFQGFSKTSK